MKALLLYPLFPQTFWSYDELLNMAGLKATLPPLGMITVAAMLPNHWDIRFVDRNVELETLEDWEWCDVVILSSMLAQRTDFLALIQKAHRLGKKVAVGGPYPTSIPDDALEAGADYLILDEGELTIPLFLEAIAQGEPSGVFRATEKPDVTLSPIPRFDLLKRDAYLQLSVQFSRGCPFQCEFCDIITLYGRKPRTKEPEQLLRELQVLYELGWRGGILIVDDNFIGNQRNVKRLLRMLIPWMRERKYPFNFMTEASINLSEDPELLELMGQAGFYGVFLGIETPDQDSLQVTKKFQNTRHPLIDACQIIHEAGLLIYSGFILGFDGERSGAGKRIQTFVEQTSIAQPMLGLLQALPNTALWQRLKQEGRLQEDSGVVALGDQNTLMNFVPSRPIEELAQEYVSAIWDMYEPQAYLRRCFEQCLKMQPNPWVQAQSRLPSLKELKLLCTLFWRQGWKRTEVRRQFWTQLGTLLKTKPGLLMIYLGLCATGEHFWQYRILTRNRITQQLGFDPILHPLPSVPTQPEVKLEVAA